MNASTTQEIINQISIAFAPVAAKIGQGAQYGWDIVMRQQYVEAVEGIMFFILGLIMAIVVIFICIKSYKEVQKDSYSDWDGIGFAVGIFGGSASIFTIAYGLEQSITHFLNPAYYALEFFINLVK